MKQSNDNKQHFSNCTTDPLANHQYEDQRQNIPII